MEYDQTPDLQHLILRSGCENKNKEGSDLVLLGLDASSVWDGLCFHYPSRILIVLILLNKTRKIMDEVKILTRSEKQSTSNSGSF